MEFDFEYGDETEDIEWYLSRVAEHAPGGPVLELGAGTGRIALPLAEAGHEVVVAVSAMGDTTDRLAGLAREIAARPPRREMDMLLSSGEQVTIALLATSITRSRSGFSVVTRSVPSAPACSSGFAGFSTKLFTRPSAPH